MWRRSVFLTAERSSLPTHRIFKSTLWVFFFQEIEFQNKFKERQPLSNFFGKGGWGGGGGKAWIINISPRKFILTSTSVYIPSSPLFSVFQVQFFRSSPRTNTNKICLSGRVSRVSYRDKLPLFFSCNFSCFLFLGKFSLSFIPVHYMCVCVFFVFHMYVPYKHLAFISIII